MVKIIGTGGILEDGKVYEVTEAMAKIIVSVGRARFEGEEVVPPKEKEVIDVEAKEKVQVTHTKKRRK